MSNPSNIIRLPTAAPHKIGNARFAEQRRAARKMRIESQWDRRFMPDIVAKPEPTIVQTPELFILMTMLECLPSATVQSIMQRAHASDAQGEAADAGRFVIEHMARFRDACQTIADMAEREGR